MSNTVPVQIRIDRDIKEEASTLFSRLGLDMSGAVNMFLHQCVLRNGLPFPVEMPHYNQSTLDAVKETRRISNNPAVKSCDSLNEVKKALDK